MTREDIDKLKGKLVSVENPYRTKPFLGQIYHVDDDIIHTKDGRKWDDSSIEVVEVREE